MIGAAYTKKPAAEPRGLPFVIGAAANGRTVTRELPAARVAVGQALFLSTWLGTYALTIVTRRPRYSRGPSGFLPVAIEGMSFFIGLFLKEKGTFGFLGALSPSKSPKSQKDLFFRKNEPLK